MMKQVANSLALEFFSEGVDEEVAAAFQKDSLLLRVNGPFIKTDGYSIEVQVVLTDLGAPSKNSKEHFIRCGAVAEALDGVISINKNGDGGGLYGCLSPDRDDSVRVKVLHFGQVDSNMKVRQSAVVASYELFI